MSTSIAICPRCRNAIPDSAPEGLCPRCVLSSAATPSGTAPAPTLLRDHGAPPAIETLAAAFPHREILSLIGTGGIGFVYHARERATSRPVALKILRAHLAGDPAFAERFQREAQTLARLDHTNIVRILGHGQSGDFCHLTMEYVDGANLDEAMRADRFTPQQALKIVSIICDALHYAHQRRVSHRDIKPWLAGSEPPARQAAVAAQLGLSEGALKVAIHRLRKRFREAILHELRQTLPDTDAPEDELRYLIEVLSQP